MADSPVFDRTCEELEQRTHLERLEVRGTVRIALKAAGLDAQSVDAEQMSVVLRRVLPDEFETRGVDDAAARCEEVAASIPRTHPCAARRAAREIRLAGAAGESIPPIP